MSKILESGTDGTDAIFTGDVTGNVTGNVSGSSGSTTGNAATATQIDGIANDAIVQLDLTQTLTNKTLTSPTLVTPTLGVASATSLTANYLTALGNNSSITDQGAYMMWNVAVGFGATSFVNSKGLGAGGFSFFNVASNTTLDPVATPPIVAFSPSGEIKAGDVTYTNTSGTNGYVLTSNGIGGTSWETTNLTGDVTGDVYASDGLSKILESGTDGTDAIFTGDVTGNLTGDVTGNVATATQIDGIANADIVQLDLTQTLTNKTLTSPTITGTGVIAGAFTGNLTGDVTGNVSGSSGSTTGNAATATVLETAKMIGGVEFDGSADIDLPGVNTTGDQDTSGNAATATQIVGIANADIVQKEAEQTLTNKTLTSPTITGTGAIAGTFTGNLTGDVTGNLTGDVTGDVYASDGLSKILESGTDGTDAIFTGDVTGNVTGNVSGSSGSTTGNAATATQIDGIANADIVQLDATQTLTNKTLTSPTITGTGVIAGAFTGNLTGDVTGNVSGSSGSTTGNAATATVLETAKMIGGVEFDGSADIDLPGVNTTGDQDTSGNAATATQIVGIANADIVQKEAEQTLTNKTLTSPTITGTGAIAGTFTGNLTGDVTGNLTGDVTGNLTGDVTGNLTGDVTGDVYASDGTNKILESGTDGTDAIFTGNVTGNLTGDVTGNVATATKIASIVNADIVQLEATQTLTNKTLTSPTLVTPTLGVASATSLTATGAIATETLEVTGATTTAGIINTGDIATETLAVTTNASVGGNLAVTGSISANYISANVAGNITGNAATATKIASIVNADIVQLDATQTLTNKTLTSPTITGTGAIAGAFTGNLTGDVTGDVYASDGLSKILESGTDGTDAIFTGDVTGNAATATQIVGIANADIVQLDATQTLTNKTLTSPTITGTGAIAGTFTGNLTGDVNGDVYASDGTNKILESGTDGTDAVFTGNVFGNAATATQIDGIANDAIVQLDATQTLTNKTLTSPTITGTGAIAGTFTGNLTVYGNLTGDVTGNVATATKIASIVNDNIVQLDATQTLTNKTLTSPTLVTPTLGVASATSLATDYLKISSKIPSGPLDQGVYSMWNLPSELNVNPAAASFVNSIGLGIGGFNFFNVATIDGLGNAVPFDSTINLPIVAFSPSGEIKAGDVTYTNTTGSNGYVLTSNGTGGTSWETTNVDLSGVVVSSANATTFGSFASDNLSTALTDETGTGAAVFSTSPTLVTPTLGIASATSLTANYLTALGNNSSITDQGAYMMWNVVDGGGATSFVNSKGLGAGGFSFFNAASNTTLDPVATPPIVAFSPSGEIKAGDVTYTNTTGTNGHVLTSNGIGGTSWETTNLTGVVQSSANATTFGSFSSDNLSTALTDETGTGAAVFSTSPTLVTPTLGIASATSLTAGEITSVGKIKAGAVNYTNTTGTNGQVLTSNGAGETSWITISPTSSANATGFPTYVVGTSYPELGGTVIHLSPSGKHGIVVADQFQVLDSNWYKRTKNINNPDFHDENGGEFFDWRIPSMQELQWIYDQQSSSGSSSESPFTNGVWSSVESDFGYAAAYDLVIGGGVYKAKNIDDLNILPVRAF